MLTREFLGYVALFIFWGNTLLVAIAASKQAFALLKRGNVLSTGRIYGRVVGDEPIAEVSVDQIGRQGAGRKSSVVWHDRAYRSRILGGLIEIEGKGVARLPAADDATVWIDPSELVEQARCKDAATFSEVFQAARKAKGYARTVTAAIGPGTVISVRGELSGSGQALAVVLTEKAALFTIEPQRFAGEKSRIVLAYFVPAMVLGAALCTLLAKHEPVFDSLVSKIGAFSAFIYFLLVLPAGTAIRDWLREPQQRILRGEWIAPHNSAAPVVGSIKS